MAEYQDVIRDDYGEVKLVRRPQDDDQTYTDDEKDRFGVTAQSYDPNAPMPPELREAAMLQDALGLDPRTGNQVAYREGGKTYVDVRFPSFMKTVVLITSWKGRQLNVNSRPEMAVPPEVRDRVFTLEDEVSLERRQSRRDVAKGAKKDGVDPKTVAR